MQLNFQSSRSLHTESIGIHLPRGLFRRPRSRSISSSVFLCVCTFVATEIHLLRAPSAQPPQLLLFSSAIRSLSRHR